MLQRRHQKFTLLTTLICTITVAPGNHGYKMDINKQIALSLPSSSEEVDEAISASVKHKQN